LALIRFWWLFQWLDKIIKCTWLPHNSIHCISINLLEYSALIVGLAGSIVAWESLPTKSRPAHPMILLLTNNTTAKSWAKRISGLKTPQCRTFLARLFAHILMFLDVGVLAEHIAGEDNVVDDYLSGAKNTKGLLAFSFKMLRTKFPWLSGSRRAVSSHVSLPRHCWGHPWSCLQRACRSDSLKMGPPFSFRFSR
jgi:hypothetical protein